MHFFFKKMQPNFRFFDLLRTVTRISDFIRNVFRAFGKFEKISLTLEIIRTKV